MSLGALKIAEPSLSLNTGYKGSCGRWGLGLISKIRVLGSGKGGLVPFPKIRCLGGVGSGIEGHTTAKKEVKDKDDEELSSFTYARRDDKGLFVKGSKVYHVVPVESLSKIKKEGLKPGPHGKDMGGAVFAFGDKDEARWYADTQTRDYAEDGKRQKFAIVVADVSGLKGAFDDTFHMGDPDADTSAIRIDGNVKSSRIKGIYLRSNSDKLHTHSCTCSQLKLNGSRIGRIDPTRTTIIRTQFSREITKRFKKIRSIIKEAVVTQDVLGLAPAPLHLLVISKKKFAYETTQEKVKGFMGWLRKEVDQNILAVEKRDGRTVTHRRPWENTYISRAYTKGMARAESELKKAGILTKKPTFFTDSINAQFNLPFHAEKVAQIYTRAYRDLEGITEFMDLKISRTLAEGLATGLSPLDMAKELADEVDMSIGRARTLARTEVIRAHHMGNIATYEQAGIEGVTVQAEWLATDDDKVCAFCESMNGRTFTLEEIKPMIPAHPSCRCVAIPSFPEEED